MAPPWRREQGRTPLPERPHLSPPELGQVYRDRAVLVTGGLGFIGSNLAHRLVELGARVSLVDALLPQCGGNLFNIRGLEDKVHLDTSDVRDRSSMNHLVRGQDFLFNLAGQISHIDSMTDPYTDLDINCRAQLSILEACRQFNREVRIVYAGTRQIYGRPEYLPVDEDHLLHPTDVNGINKMAGEGYHLVYCQVYGIRATSLRLTNTYGPRQLLRHPRQGFAPWFIRLALEGKGISVFGDGSQKRDFNYVDDVVEALLLVGASEHTVGEIYNLGGERPYSLLEFVELLLGEAGQGSYRLAPFPEDRARIDIGDYYGSFAKLESACGWRPRTPLPEGLRHTLAYYREHGQHYW